MTKTPKHFLDLDVMSAVDLRRIVDVSKAVKAKNFPGGNAKPFADKKLAMIFEKPSTRTRVSFEIGMKALGGEVVVLERESSQLGRGETVADTARVLSRYVDCIMVRTPGSKLTELAEYATVPVINGLTDRTHPCQLMADVMTFEEHLGPIQGKRITWSGDGTQHGDELDPRRRALRFRTQHRLPRQSRPAARRLINWAHENGGKVKISDNPQEAAKGCRLHRDRYLGLDG